MGPGHCSIARKGTALDTKGSGSTTESTAAKRRTAAGVSRQGDCRHRRQPAQARPADLVPSTSLVLRITRSRPNRDDAAVPAAPPAAAALHMLRSTRAQNPGHRTHHVANGHGKWTRSARPFCLAGAGARDIGKGAARCCRVNAITYLRELCREPLHRRGVGGRPSCDRTETPAKTPLVDCRWSAHTAEVAVHHAWRRSSRLYVPQRIHNICRGALSRGAFRKPVWNGGDPCPQKHRPNEQEGVEGPRSPKWSTRSSFAGARRRGTASPARRP